MTHTSIPTVRRRVTTLLLLGALVFISASISPAAQPSARKPLASGDIEDIATLVLLEDTRRFDDEALKRIMGSAHPEVRRRAVQAIGRIADPRGHALLVTARGDADPEIVATVAFAAGQLKDEESTAWLSEQLSSPRTAPAIAREAARSLGKIRSTEARAALAKYLSSAPATSAPAPVVGEALLSMGRFTTRDNLAPIVRWATSPDVEVRWRAAWALFRPRDPAAVPHLLELSKDKSAEVRYWAVRGLAPVPPPAGRGNTAQPLPDDWANIDKAPLSARLREATRDPDRRVRTEALRALAQYDDDESFGIVSEALESPDSWVSVSAAEGLARYGKRADVTVPKLVTASGTGKPLGLRMTALASLVTLRPEAALDPASALIRESSVAARTAAAQALQRLGGPGRARLEALAADPATKDLIPQGGGGRGQQRPEITPRSAAEYRAIVERWVVPDYNGERKPRAVWETPRGSIELELYAGDAPLAVEYFVHVVQSGQIVGTEFGRVVPDFVAQQRTIVDAALLRDEVSRRGLTRGNVSWASAGLDTGRPGYTLGNTPQPHNEGNFTALGGVIRGMDVVDRLELCDRITAARMEK
jgi:HEAT repeat protein/cyclophilin family peptidyl-prolyl cis-trans isomerase